MRPRARLGAAAGTLAGLVLLAGAGAALLLRRADAAGTPPLVPRALGAELRASGEVLLASAPVFRREWTHYFGATRGILAATDRRLLFVGVPPADPTPGRAAGEAPIVEQVSLPYSSGGAATLVLRPGSRAPAIELRARGRRERFAVAPPAWPAARQVVAAVAAQRAALQRAARQALEARLRAEWLAGLPVYHVIRPGDALETIAQAYAVTADSLRALNALAATRIRAGDTLLVIPGVPGATGRRIVTPAGTIIVGTPPAVPDTPAAVPAVPEAAAPETTP